MALAESISKNADLSQMVVRMLFRASSPFVAQGAETGRTLRVSFKDALFVEDIILHYVRCTWRII